MVILVVVVVVVIVVVVVGGGAMRQMYCNYRYVFPLEISLLLV